MFDSSIDANWRLEKGAYLLRIITSLGLIVLAFTIDPSTLQATVDIRQIFAVLIAGGLAYNAVVGFIVFRKHALPWLGYGLLLIDTSFISVAIYYTGGIYSHLYLLLPIFILSATARYGKKGALVSTVWIGLLLCVIWAISNNPFSTRAFEYLSTRILYLTLIASFATTFGNIKEEMHELQGVAEKAALVLENASLYEKLKESYFQTVMSLIEAVEAKDFHTRGHSEEVAVISKALAEKLGLSSRECEDIYYAALLHDVGKIGTPESILAKPGPLTKSEYEQVKRHSAKGYEIVKPVAGHNGIATYALLHHEHYDGRGYPNGAAGDEIPLGARIISVADAFQAMISDRPYRDALDIDAAVAEIKKYSGTQFDPKVVGAFLKIVEDRYFISEVHVQEANRRACP